MFEASYPLIIGERWLRANSWPAAGLAPSSLLLSRMVRLCVCFSAAASSCCSLFPVWPAGGAEQASGRDDGGGLHWRTDGPPHCIHVSLCDQWTNQLSAGSALSGDLLFVFILKIRTFSCTPEKKKNERKETQKYSKKHGGRKTELRAAAEPRGEEAEAESVPAVCEASLLITYLLIINGSLWCHKERTSLTWPYARSSQSEKSWLSGRGAGFRQRIKLWVYSELWIMQSRAMTASGAEQS